MGGEPYWVAEQKQLERQRRAVRMRLDSGSFRALFGRFSRRNGREMSFEEPKEPGFDQDGLGRRLWAWISMRF